jgi:hypothetical protein
MATSKQYDYLNRITDITSYVWTSGSCVRATFFVHEYNNAD